MSKTAIYARISRSDDFEHHVSIDNQIGGITDYCNTYGFTITKIYKDLNISGRTMDRPAFNEMMNDAENGLIDTIIVKDLSRFGRNHLEVGEYLDNIFLVNNIRFIAIDDNYDNKGQMDDFAVFKNIFNEMYLKDLRRKIKSTFDYKAKRKLLNPRLGAFYGLTIDEKGNYIIDEEAANIVRKIYTLYIEGNSTKKIALILSREKIMSPGYYRYIKYNDKSSFKNPQKDIYEWKDCTIYKILSNEEYTGRIINRKYLYEKGKRYLNPNPIIIEHGLPQIIDEDTFNKVKEIREGKPKIPDKKYINPFPNLIKCSCCEKVMHYTFSVTMNMFLYECRKCKTRIYLDDFKTIVTKDIKDQISKIDDIEVSTYCEKSIFKMKKEVKYIEKEIQNTFEYYIKGKITETQIKPKIAELTQKKNQLLEEISKKKNEQIKKILSNLLNKEIDDDLINKIVAGVKVKSVGKRKYDLHINYNFKNQIIGA